MTVPYITYAIINNKRKIRKNEEQDKRLNLNMNNYWKFENK